MSRLPFDPRKMAAAAAPSPPSAEAAPLTVSQLAVIVGRTLRDHLPATIRLVGEVGQFRERTHWYFDVKDSGAVLSCVMFATAARRAGFVPQPGQQVLLTGRVEFYDKGGRTQFMVDRIEPIGAGALDLAFRRLCDELRELGWFGEERKRPLPLFPAKVAVVTSRTGAALQDVLDTARRRCPAVAIAVADARVQGPSAAGEVAAAIRGIGRMHRELGVEVVMVTRGGGSVEDLQAFNERIVAEAIVHCPIPVVAAIGHETDITIAEMVADVRGATPTQAAMRVFPDAGSLQRQLDSLGHRLSGQVTRHLRIERERLRGAARHPFLLSPGDMVSARREELRSQARHLSAAARAAVQGTRSTLDRLSTRLDRHRPSSLYARRAVELASAEASLRGAARGLLERRAALLQSAARGLDLVGPHAVLRRGYSLTTRADGQVVRSTTQVVTGEPVTTQLIDGSFHSWVLDKDGAPVPNPPPRQARAAAAPKRPAPRARSADQMDLFGRGP